MSVWSSVLCSSDLFLHLAFGLVRLRQVGAIIADADLGRVLDAPTGLLDLGGVAETVQHHVGALGGEGGRHREADAGSRAGDEGGLAFEEHAGPFYFARSKAAVLPSMMLRVRRAPFFIVSAMAAHPSAQ